MAPKKIGKEVVCTATMFHKARFQLEKFSRGVDFYHGGSKVDSTVGSGASHELKYYYP